MSEGRFKVLVPVVGGSTPSDNILVAAGLLVDASDGQGTMLTVVEVPEERSLSEGALVVRRRRSLLRKIEQTYGGRRLSAEVRTAHSLEQGVRGEVEDTNIDLLVLPFRTTGRGGQARAVERLIGTPPCDVAVVKPGTRSTVSSVLVPARGGPHAVLALRLAESIAARSGAVLTLLHVRLPRIDAARVAAEETIFAVIREQVTYENVRLLQVDAESVEAALVSEASQHDVVLMGAAGRDERSPFLVGRIPEAVAQSADGTVIVVKTREPVTAGMFGLPPQTLAPPEYRRISTLVDRWFAENTFHSHEFRNIRYLIDLKERQGKTISLVLPTLNEEQTVGRIISTIKKYLIDRYPLIDELIVVDSDSEDRTVEIATGLGVPVHKHPDILPEHGSFPGKGEALWKSLYVTSGDIVVWIDSDITGIHPKFVYGLLGPLLTDAQVGFVKGFYRRPLNLGGQLLTTGGGRVTELTARPLINLFYPELSGLVQPLAGEMAGRRDVLEAIPFFTGYGVETGLLIDILEHSGLQSIAQADLEYRVHRNQSLLSLSKMAFAIVQVVVKRLGDRNRIHLMQDVSSSMNLIHYSPTELFLEVKEIREHERPPIKELAEYQVKFGRLEPAPVAGPM